MQICYVPVSKIESEAQTIRTNSFIGLGYALTLCSMTAMSINCRRADVYSVVCCLSHLVSGPVWIAKLIASEFGLFAMHWNAFV